MSWVVGRSEAIPNLRGAWFDGGGGGADGVSFGGLEAAAVTVANQIAAQGYERVLGFGPAIAAGGIALRAVTGEHDIFQPDLDFITVGIDAAASFRPVSEFAKVLQLLDSKVTYTQTYLNNQDSNGR